MNLEKIKKRETKKVSISIRTYPSYSKWLKEKEFSPNAIFNEAVKDLMKQEDGK